MAATIQTWTNDSPPQLNDVDLNGFKNENNNLIEGSGQTLSTGDNQQTHKAVAQYATVGTFFTGSGVANAYTLAAPPPRIAPPSLEIGSIYRFTVPITNTGASTLNAFGFGIQNILSSSGTALVGGELVAGEQATVSFNGVDFTIFLQLTDSVFADLKAGRENLLYGLFRINQEAVSGTVILAAGEYGHDGFRGGSAGATYTFATSAGITTATISAGSLEQEIEGLNILSGTHILSWTGTAQAQIDGGGFGDSGITASLTGGTIVIVEWGTGTLSVPQLEKGLLATEVKWRDLGQELRISQRYFEKSYSSGIAVGTITENGSIRMFPSDVNASQTSQYFRQEKATVPTVTIFSSVTGLPNAIHRGGVGDEAATANTISTTGFKVLKSAAYIIGESYQHHYTADARP